MTDEEFDVLDELYFLQPFNYLLEELELSEEVLKETLKLLLTKKWIRCYKDTSDEIFKTEDLDFEHQYQKYHYLASKEGLLAHNGR